MHTERNRYRLGLSSLPIYYLEYQQGISCLSSATTHSQVLSSLPYLVFTLFLLLCDVLHMYPDWHTRI